MEQLFNPEEIDELQSVIRELEVKRQKGQKCTLEMETSKCYLKVYHMNRPGGSNAVIRIDLQMKEAN